MPTLSVYEVFYAAARDRPDLLTPGTDFGEGDHAMEFDLLIDNGLSPLQALYAAARKAPARPQNQRGR